MIWILVGVQTNSCRLNPLEFDFQPELLLREWKITIRGKSGVCFPINSHIKNSTIIQVYVAIFNCFNQPIISKNNFIVSWWMWLGIFLPFLHPFKLSIFRQVWKINGVLLSKFMGTWGHAWIVIFNFLRNESLDWFSDTDWWFRNWFNYLDWLILWWKISVRFYFMYNIRNRINNN